ncbi:hypothetical protein CW751_12370 [Brumimicrobium salinarum]|uniref:Secretion system C-terminal sorting domain-containing protein n=1 Tax=Brumimicrobium salinarum TaxID=2058658 RepID=A0A2I0R089_9FLAO|nr:T9SS type A sorting domain-containing protein [Brumimicrobium salinarum]PKR80012.1 hypothetical protein CW751_12370 [Brumimicrobium salinarum]
MKKIYTFTLLGLLSLNTNAQIANPGFEEWNSALVNDWSSYFDYQFHGDLFDENNNPILPIEKMSDSPTEGEYYVKLNSFKLNSSTSPAHPDGNYGSIIRQVVSTNLIFEELRMDVKYDVKPGDAALILIQSIDVNNNILSNGSLKLTGTQSEFSSVTVNLTTFNQGTPEEYIISISSSAAEGIVNATEPIEPGSTISIDNIEIGNNLGTKKEKYDQEKIVMYPNPAKNVINFFVEKEQSGKIIIQSLLGKQVINTTFENHSRKININKLEKGVYFYSIYDSKGVLLNRRQFIVEH